MSLKQLLKADIENMRICFFFEAEPISIPGVDHTLLNQL
jgi:hypothetical protein